MTFKIASLDIDTALNKLASFNAQNIRPFHKERALNKALLNWVRRNKHGNNIYKEGNESSQMRVDDLQIFIKSKEVSSYHKDVYNEVKSLPTDYLYINKLSVYAKKGDCEAVLMDSDLREVANENEILLSDDEQPSFDFEQAPHTLEGNKIKIFHNNDFEITKVILSYYRRPKNINKSKPDEVWEIKEDLANLIVTEAVVILADAIESPNVSQQAKVTVEQEN